jgi:hypothetical protein
VTSGRKPSLRTLPLIISIAKRKDSYQNNIYS